MGRERESKLKDFYVVRQSSPTSTPPSNPNLKISLSKPPKVSNAYNWLPRCQWIFTTKRLSPNLFTQVSHTFKHSQIWWGNENYNKNSLKEYIYKLKNKDDLMNNDLRNESSINVVCLLFLLARELENESDLSLYSLSLKTSRYAHFGDNRLTVYGIQLVTFMLSL